MFWTSGIHGFLEDKIIQFEGSFFLETHTELDVLFQFILIGHLNLFSSFENQSKFVQFGSRDNFLFLIRNELYCGYM